jgi:hypothetical protein
VSDFILLLIRSSEYLIFSELLRTEYSDGDSDTNPNGNRRGEDDLDDNKDSDAERDSRVLAHVELARTVREFSPLA